MKSPALSLLLLLSAAVVLADGPTAAPAAPAPAPDPFADKLTGNWGGTRVEWAASGVTFDLESTHFYQGLMSGTGAKDWEYGGRLDTYLRLDLEKMAGWTGGNLGLHAEYFYGDLPAGLGGAALPTNLGMKLPQGFPEELIVTNIMLTQKVGGATLRLGKINTVDLLAGDLFFGGGGTARFQNLALVAPPNGVLSPVIMGGMVGWRADPLNWALIVFDPNSRTDDYWPDDLFSDGVSVSLGATWAGRVAGRTTTVNVTGICSSKDGASLGDVILPPGSQTTLKRGSWHASVLCSHLLHENPERPGDGWGLYAKLGVSDGDPTPYQTWISGGLGGKGLFPGRPQDSFGVGGFYYSFSNKLTNALTPLLKVGDESGLEAYYNFLVAPGLRLTADLQIIRPAVKSNGTAVIGGLRANLRF